MKSIKRSIIMLAMLAGVLCWAVAAHALSTAARSASGSGSTEAVVIVPGDNSSAGKVLAVNATSDKAGSYVKAFWYDGFRTTVDQSSAAAGTTLYVGATTGFSASDIIIVQSASGGTTEELTVSGVTSGVSLTTSSNLVNTWTAGATVTKVGDSNTDNKMQWPVGAATVEKTGVSGVIIGPRNSPVMLLLDGTSACVINYVTWDFTD